MLPHSQGENDFDDTEEFDFSFSGGGFQVERGSRQLTSHGGLAAFGKFVKKLGIIEQLENTCPIIRSSPNATPVGDILRGFILACVSGANRFSDIDMVRYDDVIAKAMGVKTRIRGEDAFPRLFTNANMEKCRTWMLSANSWLWQSFAGKDFLILDWDSTVLTRYGFQEAAQIGYNPTKPGRPSHHPLLCTIAGTRLVPMLQYRDGKSCSKAYWTQTMETLSKQMPKDVGLYLNRGDVAFGCEEILAWHENTDNAPKYLFRIKKSPGINQTISGVSDWEGNESINSLQVCERRIKLQGWSSERRVVLGRRLREKIAPGEGELLGYSVYDHYAWVTSLEPNQIKAWQLAELYFQRADCENVFDELKNHWGFSGFCSNHLEVTEMAAWVTLLSYNLWTMFVRVMNLGIKEGHEEAKNSRKNFLKIPAQMCVTGRRSILKLSVSDTMWERLKKSYRNLVSLLKQTAPQLEFLKENGCAIFEKIAPGSRLFAPS